ncbi:unnamed protein product [Caenorhabditis sp. 36 PRJEB53466]|nr:unnamed protein product [Caenorhabditis sp. 36 PRJEB53466]
MMEQQGLEALQQEENMDYETLMRLAAEIVSRKRKDERESVQSKRAKTFLPQTPDELAQPLTAAAESRSQSPVFKVPRLPKYKRKDVLKYAQNDVVIEMSYYSTIFGSVDIPSIVRPLNVVEVGDKSIFAPEHVVRAQELAKKQSKEVEAIFGVEPNSTSPAVKALQQLVQLNLQPPPVFLTSAEKFMTIGKRIYDHISRRVRPSSHVRDKFILFGQALTQDLHQSWLNNNDLKLEHFLLSPFPNLQADQEKVIRSLSTMTLNSKWNELAVDYEKFIKCWTILIGSVTVEGDPREKCGIIIGVQIFSLLYAVAIKNPNVFNTQENVPLEDFFKAFFECQHSAQIVEFIIIKFMKCNDKSDKIKRDEARKKLP